MIGVVLSENKISDGTDTDPSSIAATKGDDDTETDDRLHRHHSANDKRNDNDTNTSASGSALHSHRTGTKNPNDPSSNHVMHHDYMYSSSTHHMTKNTTTRMFCQSMSVTDSSSGGGGGGMIMYMDGFHWTTYSYYYNHHDQSMSQIILPCLNILSPSYTIETIAQFYTVCFLVFLLAMAIEGITKLRYTYIRHVITLGRSNYPPYHRQQQQQRHHRCGTCHNLKCKRNHFYHYHRFMIPLLHGIQAFMGYLLMLMVMTYSIELFICAILGLMIGYYIFFVASYDNTKNDEDSINRSPTVQTAVTQPDSERDPLLLSQQQHQHQRDLLLLTTMSSSNPCCDFLQSPSMN